MKKAIALLLTAAVLTGCGVSQADYDKLKKENEQLSKKVETYEREEKTRNNTSIKKAENNLHKALGFDYKCTNVRTGNKRVLIIWRNVDTYKDSVAWDEEGEKIGKWVSDAYGEDWFEWHLVYVNFCEDGQNSIATMEIISDPSNPNVNNLKHTNWLY